MAGYCLHLIAVHSSTKKMVRVKKSTLQSAGKSKLSRRKLLAYARQCKEVKKKAEVTSSSLESLPSTSGVSSGSLRSCDKTSPATNCGSVLGNKTRSQFKCDSYNAVRSQTESGNVSAQVVGSRRGIVDFSRVDSFVTKLSCPQCQNSTLQFKTDQKKPCGLAVHSYVFCTTCEEVVDGTEGFLAEKGEGGEKDFNINRQAVFSSLVCGLGSTVFNNWSEMMDLQGLHHKTFHKKAAKLYDRLGDFEMDWFTHTAQYVRQIHAQHAGITLGSEDVLDISVSFDGTWLTRGHSSHIGVGCVVDLLTGLCIDAHVMCTYCQVCESTGRKLSTADKPQEYAAWVVQHAPKCDKNFTGLFSIFRNKVCYEDIGCFNNEYPFTNSWHQLPQSPEEIGISLKLFTRSGPPQGEGLALKDAKSIVTSHFDLQAHTKVIIHGYINNGSDYWIVNMTRALLKSEPVNVIVVAWGPGAHALYPKAVANTRVVGAVTARFLTSLKDELNVSMSGVHLIGHSLGAHIAGYVGSSVPGIARISGLDPAGPLFESTAPAVRIDPSDAKFVDCIHSDGLPLDDFGFGTLSAWCDVDFYPNGGLLQTGCPKPVSGTLKDVFSLKVMDAESAVSCSHSRSHDLFVDSINQCRYSSIPCDSYEHFQAGQCTCNTRASGCVAMGYHAADNVKGKFYLHTTGTEPFC